MGALRVCTAACWLVLLGAGASSGQAPQTATGRTYSSPDPIVDLTPAPEFPSPVQFFEPGPEGGLNFRHQASPTSQKYLLETMGGGVGLLDYDNDGRLDVYVTNGARLQDPMPPGAAPDKSDPRYWNRLYRQNGSGGFEDVTERAGLRGEGYGMGVAAADYDNDGWVDLYVTAYGSNRLYRNQGDGTFRDVTSATGTGGSGWSTSAGWFDADADGRLDLLVARYMEWDFERGSIYCGDRQAGIRSYCHPENFPAAAPLFFHQQPDGTFQERSRAAGLDRPAGKGLGVAFADFDSDGWMDAVVANDGVRQSLFINQGEGRFEEAALAAGVAYDENGRAFAGMGVDCADYNNDGHPDLWITALSNEAYPLFRNDGNLTFTYDSNRSGAAQISLLYSGWGTRFMDADNDGLLDIFVAQSHVMDDIARTSPHLSYRQPLLLMRNTGSGFVAVSRSAGSPFERPLAARGAAFGDLDNDGDLDAVVASVGDQPVVLRNGGTDHPWVGLALAGSSSNREGLGARVTAHLKEGGRRVFDVSRSGSYLSSHDPRLLIGLGASVLESVEIRWPSGRVSRLEKAQPNRYHLVREE